MTPSNKFLYYQAFSNWYISLIFVFTIGSIHLYEFVDITTGVESDDIDGAPKLMY